MKQGLINEIKNKTNIWEQEIQSIQRETKLEDPNLYFLGNVLNYITDLQMYVSKTEE